MVLSQPKSPSWSKTVNSKQLTVNSKEELITDNWSLITELPCLDSSNDCVEQLTRKAIASSSKLKQTASRIALIEERLALTEERIDYTSKKKWTNYISTNPVDIIQNIFGGGGVQRDNLAIASLEIRTTDLLAAKAELERQQEEEKIELSDRILKLLLDYEAASRRQELLVSQLETLERQREVTRIAYRFGRGSTAQVLDMEDRRDRLYERLVDAEIEKDEAVRELKELTVSF